MTRFFLNKVFLAVGTAARQPDQKWRLTTWRPDGPSGHQVLTDDQLKREVRSYWAEWPVAGLILDQWSKTPKWEHGLKQIQFLQAWNTLSYLGRYDLGHELDATKTLDEALALAPELIKQAQKEACEVSK
jgi:hypothetical protein